PAPSCPATTGMGCWVAPLTRCQSLWQTPTALMRTSTSPARGGSSVNSSIMNGFFASVSKAALIFIRLPFYCCVMPIRIKPPRGLDAKIVAWILCVLAVRSFAAEPSKAFLLHLPGIGGHMRIDDVMTAGLLEGGVNGELEIYDWTDND